mmetsp:Transcript_130635/g.225936  ORF Transcript_130635/g.225936 Transcript_130635/m.225936 type:complete len:568 (+) Transcript_130635:1689-3392(+)
MHESQQHGQARYPAVEPDGPLEAKAKDLHPNALACDGEHGGGQRKGGHAARDLDHLELRERNQCPDPQKANHHLRQAQVAAGWHHVQEQAVDPTALDGGEEVRVQGAVAPGEDVEQEPQPEQEDDESPQDRSGDPELVVSGDGDGGAGGAGAEEVQRHGAVPVVHRQVLGRGGRGEGVRVRPDEVHGGVFDDPVPEVSGVQGPAERDRQDAVHAGGTHEGPVLLLIMWQAVAAGVRGAVRELGVARPVHPPKVHVTRPHQAGDVRNANADVPRGLASHREEDSLDSGRLLQQGPLRDPCRCCRSSLHCPLQAENVACRAVLPWRHCPRARGRQRAWGRAGGGARASGRGSGGAQRVKEVDGGRPIQEMHAQAKASISRGDGTPVEGPDDVHPPVHNGPVKGIPGIKGPAEGHGGGAIGPRRANKGAVLLGVGAQAIAVGVGGAVTEVGVPSTIHPTKVYVTRAHLPRDVGEAHADVPLCVQAGHREEDGLGGRPCGLQHPFEAEIITRGAPTACSCACSIGGCGAGLWGRRCHHHLFIIVVVPGCHGGQALLADGRTCQPKQDEEDG